MNSIKKTNNRSGDFWDRFAELGKKDNQIRNIVNLLIERRENIVKIFESENHNTNLFREDNSRFSISFDDYLNNKVKELIINKINAEEACIFEEIISRFKVKLFNFLKERANRELLCEIKFDDGYSLYKAFEALETIDKKAVFQITSKGVNAYSVNESKTYLAIITMVVNDKNFLFLKNSELLINISKVAKNLKCNKSENITVTLKFEENALVLELFSKAHRSRISRIIKDVQKDFENESIIDELTEIQYPGFFALDKEKFFHILSQMGRISEITNLKLTNNMLCFSEWDSEVSGEIKWDKNSISEIEIITNDQNKEVINVYFSSENLKCFTPFLFEDFPLIKFYLKDKVPMMLQVDFKSLDKSKGLFFLAQREIKNDG